VFLHVCGCGDISLIRMNQSHAGRQNPSVSKIHYTLSLADCQGHSFRAVSDALELLSTLPRTEASVSDWIARVEKDLVYLQVQLQEVGSKLDELRRAVKTLYMYRYTARPTGLTFG
jgi:hypothetical protein